MLPERISLIKERFRSYILYLVVLVLVLLTMSLARNILQISQAENRVDDVRERVESLRQENEKLKDELGKVEGEAYVEFQARDKLGLTKEGEIVVVLPKEDFLRKIAPKIEEEEEFLPESTWQKWLKLFY